MFQYLRWNPRVPTNRYDTPERAASEERSRGADEMLLNFSNFKFTEQVIKMNQFCVRPGSPEPTSM